MNNSLVGSKTFFLNQEFLVHVFNFLNMNIIHLFSNLEWSESENKAYCLSNEEKVATRTSEGLSHVLYSNGATFIPDNTLTIKILDDADKSPGDGLCISVNNQDTDFFGKEEIIYVNLYGKKFQPIA